MQSEGDEARGNEAEVSSSVESPPRPGCPVCGGHLIEIRGKLQCERCRAIVETCCEGGPP
jgi:hypothetical protein